MINPNPWTRTLYVNSAFAGASDLRHSGLDALRPLETLRRAVLNAQAGDLIVVGPGHTENVDADEYIKFNLSDLHVRGIGNGDARPKFAHVVNNATVSITAPGVTLENLVFLADASGMVVMVEVAAVDAALIDLFVGQASAHVPFAIALGSLGARCRITRLQARHPIGGGQSCILFASSNDVTIEDCDISGSYAVACIQNNGAASQVIIARNLLENCAANDPVISMSSTTSGRIVDNRCRLATDGGSNWIVAADMDWYENYGVNLDGETGKLIGVVSS